MRTTVLLSVLLATSNALAGGPDGLVPQPVQVRTAEGRFTLNAATKLAGSSALSSETAYLAELCNRATGFQLSTVAAPDALSPCISLALDRELAVNGPEAYTLSVTPTRVAIRGATAAGVFRGIQTLRQLLPAQIESRRAVSGADWSVPCVEISDHPRFPWRGAMLDPARHFISVEDTERFIDLMALQKLNTLHWHLTDDQGWRVEIKKHPRLTEVGSVRPESPVEGNRNKGDGKPHGGFYTHEQIRRVVAYAKARHITVVPEIEMPGHARAALAAYPELGCTGGPYGVGTRWGVEPEVFCAGNPKVYQLLEDVLTEVLPLFPGQFVHVGGDECPKDRWKKCAKCQDAIKKNGLKDEHELQSHLIQHFDKWLAARGKRLIGWDEILEGGLAPGAAVMSWRGINGGKTAAKAGHDVVMTPTSHCYIDYAQSKAPGEPETIGGHLPLKTVYGYEPVPADLPAEQHKHILGTQGNLWGEYMFNYAKVEYMAFPRLCALAETGWTPAALKNYDQFRQRVGHLLARFDVLGVTYRKLDAEPVVAAQWKSGETTEQVATRDWDITKSVKKAGPVTVTFQYTSGQHRLDIQSTALLVNGQQVAIDTHDGVTGSKNSNNVYRLSLQDLPAAATITLRAKIRSDGGADSNGDILID